MHNIESQKYGCFQQSHLGSLYHKDFSSMRSIWAKTESLPRNKTPPTRVLGGALFIGEGGGGGGVSIVRGMGLKSKPKPPTQRSQSAWVLQWRGALRGILSSWSSMSRLDTSPWLHCPLGITFNFHSSIGIIFNLYYSIGFFIFTRV